MPSCFMLLTQLVRLAASRTFCTAGSKSAMRMAMIAITTNSSIRVKPLRFDMRPFLSEKRRGNRKPVPETGVNHVVGGRGSEAHRLLKRKYEEMAIWFSVPLQREYKGTSGPPSRKKWAQTTFFC